MADIIFIGDEITAAGFRLAGIEARTPDPDVLVAAVEEARGNCRVLMMTPAVAASLPGRLLEELEGAGTPLLTLVPDVQGKTAMPDLEAEARRALGIEV